MTKFALTGMILCICGLLTMGYQSLTGLMAMKTSGKIILMSDIFGEKAVSWSEQLSTGLIHAAAAYIVNMPLSYMFFFIGGFFLILSCFQK